MSIKEGEEVQTNDLANIFNKRIALSKLPKSWERDTHPGTGGF
jgi:hypothetical protein